MNWQREAYVRWAVKTTLNPRLYLYFLAIGCLCFEEPKGCPGVPLSLCWKFGLYWKSQRALRISSSSSLMAKVGLQQLVTELVTPQTSVCMWKACLANHSSYVHYLPLFRCICTLGGKRQSSIQSTCCGNIKKNVFMQVLVKERNSSEKITNQYSCRKYVWMNLDLKGW